MDEFSDWLRASSSNRQAYCYFCRKHFDVTNMGIAAVKSHSRGKKHQQIMKNTAGCKTLTVVQGNKEKQTDVVTNRKSSQSSNSLSEYKFDKQVYIAEITWILKMIESKMSFRSSDNVVAVFRKMFPSCNELRHMSLGRDKVSYSITHGLGPYFCNELLSELNRSSQFVICFDESMNRVTQKKQMDFHVRYFNPEKNCVMTRYLCSSFVGHATANDLKNEFLNKLSKLDRKKILQISMDGPNVNLKFYKDFCEVVENEDNTKFLNLGTCSLHSVHNAFGRGMDACNFKINEMMCAIWTFFHDAPARREDFSKLCNTEVFPLKCCPHRWVENIPVIKRCLEMLPHIKQFVENLEQPGRTKASKPNSNSFKVVAKATRDNSLVEGQLHFAYSIAIQLNPFLLKYQSDAPLAPFLGKDFECLLLSFLRRFMKHEFLRNIDVKSLSVDDIDNSRNYRPLDNIDIGFAAVQAIEGNNLPSKVLEFKTACRSALVAVSKHLLKHNPSRYSTVEALRCLNPRHMSENLSDCATDFRKLLQQLIDCRRTTEEQCDVAMSEYRKLLLDDDLATFDEKEDRLDNFFLPLLKNKEVLSEIFKNLLILSHGQASVERGFSANKQMMREGLSEETIVAMRQVHDSVAVQGGEVKIQIGDEMIAKYTKARAAYRTYLQSKEYEAKTKEKEINLKRAKDQLSELKLKRSRLVKDKLDLTEEANTLAFLAEKKGDISLITKSNAMRKSAIEKENELKELDVVISSVQKKISE